VCESTQLSASGATSVTFIRQRFVVVSVSSWRCTWSN